VNKQYAIVAELDRCIGCCSCQAACKYENDIPLGTARIHTYTMGPIGTFPKLSMYFLPLMCQQCENPACEAACPTGACRKSGGDGVVRIDAERCVGCKDCMNACPYHANNFNPELHIMDNCTICSGQRERGELPACVRSCAGGALHFGDVNDPESEAAKLLAANEGCVYSLKEVNGCRPSGRFILKRSEWIDELPFEFETALRKGEIDR